MEMNCWEKLYNEIRNRFAAPDVEDETVFEAMSEPLASIMRECAETLAALKVYNYIKEYEKK